MPDGIDGYSVTGTYANKDGNASQVTVEFVKHTPVIKENALGQGSVDYSRDILRERALIIGPSINVTAWNDEDGAHLLGTDGKVAAAVVRDFQPQLAKGARATPSNMAKAFLDAQDGKKA